jgi:glycosyltransferase involved in cell wall biosynthesis
VVSLEAPVVFVSAGHRLPASTPWQPTMPELPIRVLHLDHTAKLSGGEIALVRMLEAIDRTQVQPVVVLAEDGPLREALESIAIEVTVLPLSDAVRDVRKDAVGFGSFGKVGAMLEFLRYSRRIARFARANRCHIIHTNSLKSDFYGGLAGRLAGLPVVWHMRDHIDASYLPRTAVAAVRVLARTLPRFVVANSASTLRQLLPETKGQSTPRARVVHGGIDPAGGGTWPTDPPEPPRNAVPRIGMVGRIARWKGQHVMLEAAALLRQRGKSVRWVVVGTALFGEEEFEAELQRRTAELGLSDEIEWVGFSNRIPELMRTFDVFVHTSISPEPFGQVVIEAMSEGVPVIGADAGGVREIVADGETGILTPPGDPVALAQAVEALLDNPSKARQMGVAGYRRMTTTFTARRTAESMVSVFREILGHR